MLLANKAEVNAKDNSGATPLHYAAAEGHKDVAELLLANKAEVNAKDQQWPDAFARGGGKRATRTWRNCCWPTKPRSMPRTTIGQTPLHMAACKGHKDVAELLLANKAEVNAKDNNGVTPLHLAAAWATRTWWNCCWPTRADVNAKDNKVMTPLRLAVDYKGHKDVAELLRQHGGHE